MVLRTLSCVGLTCPPPSEPMPLKVCDDPAADPCDRLGKAERVSLELAGALAAANARAAILVRQPIVHDPPNPAGPMAAERDLVARLCDGDRAAMETTYVAHHAAIRRFARRLVGDAVAAEDIVHEAFVTLPRAIRGFRGDSSLHTFLIGIAANRSRAYVRAAIRRRRATERLAAHQVDEPASACPTDELARRRLAAQMWTALDHLPTEQRLVLVLCDAEQRTAGEVARIVGAPEATVRTRLAQARRKLRRYFSERGA